MWTGERLGTPQLARSPSAAAGIWLDISSAFIHLHLYCTSHFAPLLLAPVMISLLGLLLAYVAVRASAASPEAQVYVFPQSTQAESQPPSISPKDARLFFAQQLGVSEYYSIGEAEESTLHLLNAHAGRQRPLFKEGRNGPRRALLILEGVEHPEGHPTKLSYSLIVDAKIYS